jgi:hypothetical protein
MMKATWDREVIAESEETVIIVHHRFLTCDLT